MKNKYNFETLQLHAGNKQTDTQSCAVPIYQTAAYVFDNFEQAENRFALKDAGNIYGRLTNPTQSALEDRICALEGGVGALAVASGAAAINYVLCALAQNGGHIVAQKTIYGGSYNLLANTLSSFGISTSFVDINNLAEVESAITNNTRGIFIETLGNPNSDIPDIEEIAKIAHSRNIPLVVDNTFATPYLLRPIEFGADIVVHSATKFLGGHGTTLGGVIVDSGNFNWESDKDKFSAIAAPNPSYHGLTFSKAVGPAAFITYIRAVLLRDTGGCISPINAFLLLQGVETLSLRLDKHIQNTIAVVKFLSSHPLVLKVNHPLVASHPNHSLYNKYFKNGGGSIFTFEIKSGKDGAKKFIDSLQIFTLLANVADLKSLVIHPATTTHSQLNKKQLEDLNITDGTIRLSIGTEHIDDIISDLANAFDAI